MVLIREPYAGVAHPVERHLAKVEVASSSLVTRSRKPAAKLMFCSRLLFCLRCIWGLPAIPASAGMANLENTCCISGATAV